MSKIRINELARELEVKSREVIEKLHELGLEEKITHSSSIDDDMAERLRRYYAGGGAERVERAPAPELPAVSEVKEEAAKPAAPAPAVKEEAPKAAETPAPAAEAAPPAEAPKEEEPKSRSLPLRPPLLGRGTPVHPPVGPRPAGTPAVPPAARPVAPHAAGEKPVPAPPVATPPPVSAPLRPAVPTRPIPAATRPGQVLSGPRQPLPANMPPAPAAAGPAPGQPIAPVRPGVPIAPPPRPASAGPGAPLPGAPRPAAPQQPQRPLAGQPAARPVVPPRPDLAAKLQQPRSPMPGQAAPRPGVPLRPQTPRPGQPLYQGPARPGQPPMQARGGRPGMPGPGGPRPGGPRPMHPTSRPTLLPGAPPPAGDTTAGRRLAQKPGGRGGQGRRREDQEKILRPSTRREQAAPPPINRDITISEGITVKELSEKLDVKANFVIKKLVDRGIFATINQTLDAKLATDIAREFGASTTSVTYEEEAMQDVQILEEAKDLERRPPVVTIMGHVDHGKTSLLDSIRLANVAEKEAGGITQHIGAYHVEKNGQKIVFIDTPGHEAFTRMRARGAKVTDIVILVVAADDGVMPQTLEAIDHAKAAGVPIIVAINKIDKPEAQPDRIKQQLSDRGLLAEDWGGDVVMVPVSARTKQNLDLLLEMILLVAEMLDLKANAARPAMATVLEAKLDRGRGPVATLLVRNGTLRVGDDFICGSVFGRVRAMLDDRGDQVKEAGPSMPVEVLGLAELPEAGDSFQAVTDTAKAKQIVLYRAEKERAAALAKTGRITLEQFHKQMAAGEVKELPIILKADVGGSAEVLRDTLEKLSNDKVTIRVLRAGVGAINESDVDLAVASNAIIVGFNVRPERNATAKAEQEKVDIRLHTIIYELVDEMKKAMAGLLAPVYKELYKGRAEVREVFRVSKVGTVAGCLVVDGNVTRDSQVRVLRDNVVIHTGRIGSLRRFKDDVSEVRSGMECGITVDNFNDVHQGDVIEAFVMQRVANEAA
jgi:translation initiation factor IF-2